jgi:hypothetical protein
MNDIEVDFTFPQEEIDVEPITQDDYDFSIFAVKGDKGQDGIDGTNGRGISSIGKTSTSGLVDTYTITYTDNTTSTFNVTNGQDGEVTQEYVDNAISNAIGSINSVLSTLTNVEE